MNARIALRTVSIILICVGVVVYIAAKIDFFRHYGEANYFQHHSTYWLWIAAIGFIIFLLERLSSEKPIK